MGIYNALNYGVSKAEGSHIMFYNSDDYLVDNVLDGYLSFIKKNIGDIYYGHFQKIKNGAIIGKYPKAGTINKLLFKMGFNILVYYPTVILRKDTFWEMGWFDESCKIASDYGFRLKCIANKKRFVYYPEIITLFRVHKGSISSNGLNKKREMMENYYFRKKYFLIR